MEHNVCILLCLGAILLWTSCNGCDCPPDHSSTSSCSHDDDSESSTSNECGEPSTIYSYTVEGIDGNDICLGDYKGKVLLIVNYAEACGFTEPNMVGLSSLCDKYKSQGLEVLVFPSNTFKQNPSGNAAGKKLAQDHPDFVVFSEVNVNEPCEEPLYTYLKRSVPDCSSKDIEWNFTKFLVSREGYPVKRFEKTDSFDCIETSVKDTCGC